MKSEFKYRQYTWRYNVFTCKVKLLGVKAINKLPKNAKKSKSKSGDVWQVPVYDHTWSKICRMDSDIDFGTGTKYK